MNFNTMDLLSWPQQLTLDNCCHAFQQNGPAEDCEEAIEDVEAVPPPALNQNLENSPAEPV